MAKTFKISTVGWLRLREAAVQQGLVPDIYEWARRYFNGLGIVASDRGISGGTFLTGSPSAIAEFVAHAEAVNASVQNKAITNMVAVLTDEESSVPTPKKLPKDVVTRHHRVVRFTDGIKGKLFFDRLQDGSLKVWSPGRVAVTIHEVASKNKPFRAFVADKQSRFSFGMVARATERDAFRAAAEMVMVNQGW